MGISEREHHIKVLEQFLHDYQEWGEDLELEETIKYAISSLKTDLKYDLMYEGEDVYTKADIITVLEEIQLEIEENVLADDPNTLLLFLQARESCVAIIQQKINKLKGMENEKRQ